MMLAEKLDGGNIIVWSGVGSTGARNVKVSTTPVVLGLIKHNMLLECFYNYCIHFLFTFLFTTSQLVWN